MGHIRGKNKAPCLPQTGLYITKETINHHDGAITSQVTGHVTTTLQILTHINHNYSHDQATKVVFAK
jgi:hypothetical protein